MNDAQTWTLIGGFLAIMVAMVTLVLRIVRVEIAKLETRIDGVQSVLAVKIDHLDRDVQSITTHLFGGQQGGAP